MNSKEQASFLPWKQNQPNGGREENFAKVSLNLFQDENKVKFCSNLTKSNFVKKVELVDSGGDSPGCASCQLHNFLLLHLEGLCDHSFLGTVPAHLGDIDIISISDRQRLQNHQCWFFCGAEWLEEHNYQVEEVNL